MLSPSLELPFPQQGTSQPPRHRTIWYIFSEHIIFNSTKGTVNYSFTLFSVPSLRHRRRGTYTWGSSGLDILDHKPFSHRFPIPFESTSFLTTRYPDLLYHGKEDCFILFNPTVRISFHPNVHMHLLVTQSCLAYSSYVML